MDIIGFEETFRQMQIHGMNVPQNRVHFKINNAKEVLRTAISHALLVEDKKLVWLPEYDRVAEWLSDNEGKGLFLYGDCGRGKSLLSRYVIPAILLRYKNMVLRSYDAQQMNTQLDEVLSKRFISLDDIGTEDIANNFGNKRMAFFEVMDAVEKQGKLVVISTNLSKDLIVKTYKNRVYERIIATTKRIEFKGESLRK